MSSCNISTIRKHLVRNRCVKDARAQTICWVLYLLVFENQNSPLLLVVSMTFERVPGQRKSNPPIMALPASRL